MTRIKHWDFQGPFLLCAVSMKGSEETPGPKMATPFWGLMSLGLGWLGVFEGVSKYDLKARGRPSTAAQVEGDVPRVWKIGFRAMAKDRFLGVLQLDLFYFISSCWEKVVITTFWTYVVLFLGPQTGLQLTIWEPQLL